MGSEFRVWTASYDDWFREVYYHEACALVCFDDDGDQGKQAIVGGETIAGWQPNRSYVAASNIGNCWMKKFP